MFYNLIYFNESLFDNYYSIANAGQTVQFHEIEAQTDKSGSLGIKGANINAGKSSTLKGEVVNNPVSKLISLEKSLEDHDYYKNIEDDDVANNLDVLNKGMIFKATLPLQVHEEFDMYEMMGAMKEQLLNPELMGVESNDADIFKSIFNIDDLTIPVYNEELDKVIFSKLNKNYLLIDDNALEELDEDNIVLAKVKKNYTKRFTLFDPLKDLIKLNRAMRKEMERGNKNSKDLNPIIVDSKGIEVEIIAIYN